MDTPNSFKQFSSSDNPSDFWYNKFFLQTLTNYNRVNNIGNKNFIFWSKIFWHKAAAI